MTKPVEQAEVREAFEKEVQTIPGCAGVTVDVGAFWEQETWFNAGWQASRRAAFDRAIEIVEQEEREYIANSKACDMAGAHFSANSDINGALACRNVAEALRKERDQQ